MEKRISQKKRNRQDIRESEKKSGKKPLMLAILVLVILAAATNARITVLKEKESSNNIKIEQIRQAIASEEQRQQYLEDYADYIKSKDFIIDMAREKLGLVFENEIIFQPKGE